MNAVAWRAAIFVLLLVLLVLAEWRWPRHQGDPDRRHRWPVNLGFGLVGALCLRLLLPWLAIDAALWAQQHHVGLLHLWPLPSWLAIVVTLMALDLLIYAQHRLMHQVGWLWRLHRLHHSDLTLDASSAMRFHPLEILFSMGLKIAAVLALGAAPVAVLAFENQAKVRYLLLASYLGDSSYSIYLWHTMAISVVAKVAPILALPVGLSFAAAVISGVAIGTVAHEILEKPIAAFMKGRRGMTTGISACGRVRRCPAAILDKSRRNRRGRAQGKRRCRRSRVT